MNKIRANLREVLIITTLALIYPYASHGSLIQYDANGSAQTTDGVNFSITGSVTIDDTLRLWEGSSSEPATAASGPLEQIAYSYFINDFNLSITDLSNPNNKYT